MPIHDAEEIIGNQMVQVKFDMQQQQGNLEAMELPGTDRYSADICMS